MDTVLRLLSACSLFFSLSKGIIIRRSTPNNSLRFPALEVRVETSDLQDGNRDTSPTWEQWRWEFDMPNSNRVGAYASEIGEVDVASFSNCARFSSPSPNQFSAELDLEMIYQPMLLADHIYCLCVQCEVPKFPSSWAGKVSMLNVIEADSCLKQQDLNHFQKATTMHKLVLWAAKDQGLRTAMVLEEDFVLPDEKDHRESNFTLPFDYARLGEFIRSGSWDFLRFGHMPWEYARDDGRCKRECACVVEELSDNVCTTDVGCDIRSSVAYMVSIRESILDRFLKAPGVIDCPILQGFRQSYVVPAVIHQGVKFNDSLGWYAKEVEKDSSFLTACLTRERGEPAADDDPQTTTSSPHSADADVLVVDLDTTGHMRSTVFGGFEPGVFHGLLYSFSHKTVEFRGLSEIAKAFQHVEKVRPRLALWLLPFSDGDEPGILRQARHRYRGARSRSPGTRHGVFYWPPERCDRVSPSDVEKAYGDVDFVFQFGFQDERLAAKDPQKFLPWPLGTAGWRSWKTPSSTSLAPLSGRENFASFRGTRETHPGVRELEMLGQVPGIVVEFRDGLATNDSQADADRYRELLATSQYALSPPGRNANSYRIQEAVESGAVPVIVPGTNGRNTTFCYDNWSGLYGLPVGNATAYPWIPTAPFMTLHAFRDLIGDTQGMRAGATDETGRQLKWWYRHWRRAFHDQLEQRVSASLALSIPGLSALRC